VSASSVADRPAAPGAGAGDRPRALPRGAARAARRAALWPPLLVAVLTLALYLPSSARVVQLSPDMVETVDIARRLVAGEGYRLGIKAYHVGGTEVVHDGLIHRPPLLTLAIAALFRLGLDLHAVQAAHSLVGALAAALVCSIGMRLFGRAVGVAAGVLAATNPLAFWVQVPLMTEALATLLTLAGVRLLLDAPERPTGLGHGPVVRFGLAGLLFGLGYLARPPVLAVFAVAAMAVLLVARDRRRLAGPLAALAAGALLVLVPTTLYSLLTRGRLVYSGKTYLYAVKSDHDVIEEGFIRPIPTPAEFLAENWDHVARTILDLFGMYARWLFLEWDWLLPLLPAWPFALAALLRGRYPRGAWVALAAAGANYVFYALTWASWQDRFMLPTLLLLLPFGVDGLFRGLRLLAGLLPERGAGPARARPLLAPVVGGLLVGGIALSWLPELIQQYRGAFTYFDRQSGTRVSDGVRWTGPPRWVNGSEVEDAADWLERRTGPDEVIAAGQPWPYAFLTRRPAVGLPDALTEERMRDFLVEYRVSYLIFDPRERYRRQYREYLDRLEGEGVRATRVGPLLAYDARALWR
jgi:hypothetical protein